MYFIRTQRNKNRVQLQYQSNTNRWPLKNVPLNDQQVTEDIKKRKKKKKKKTNCFPEIK